MSKMYEGDFLYDKEGNKLSLYDLANFFIKTYPKGIEKLSIIPNSIKKLREGFEEILNIKKERE